MLYNFSGPCFLPSETRMDAGGGDLKSFPSVPVNHGGLNVSKVATDTDATAGAGFAEHIEAQGRTAQGILNAKSIS